MSLGELEEEIFRGEDEQTYDLSNLIAQMEELEKKNERLETELRLARDLLDQKEMTIVEMMNDRVKLAKENARLKGGEE